jgi:OPA family glycerol-3-phosphate transporter-like MFS transporter
MNEQQAFRRWQRGTVALMVVGYSGYYLCRSSFSVNLPLIIDELARHGMDPGLAKVRLGAVASFGVLAYAVGKFIAGASTDFLTGRRSFLWGMGGAVLFSLLFASGQTIPLFTLAWIGNRLVQSAGWVGMVKITSRWFAYSAYGRAMGVISLSYLFGDAVSRLFMGWLLGMGLGWRAVFCIGALVLLAILVVNAIWLRESPLERGFPEPPARADSVFGVAGTAIVPVSLGALLGPLIRTPAFLIVCVLSLGLTLVRETFNTWTPTYLTEVAGLSSAAAANSSASFPFFGGVAVLAAGFASDRLGRVGRAWIIVLGMATSALVLASLGHFELAGSPVRTVALIAVLGCLLMGPYSYLAGAIALDFGAKQGSATACGIIDGVGYLGGVLAGDTIARVSESYGWTGAFTILAVIAGASAVVGVFLLVDQRQRDRKLAQSLREGV